MGRLMAMEATAVVPVTDVEEQPIGDVVCLAFGSPVVDEAIDCDDVVGDDAAALARAAGANLCIVQTPATKTRKENM